jgi:hypothetical protein
MLVEGQCNNMLGSKPHMTAQGFDVYYLHSAILYDYHPSKTYLSVGLCDAFSTHPYRRIILCVQQDLISSMATFFAMSH